MHVYKLQKHFDTQPTYKFFLNLLILYFKLFDKKFSKSLDEV